MIDTTTQHGGADDQPWVADQSARRNTLAYGAGPNSIAVDAVNDIAYVALYNANAIAVVNLNADTGRLGMIPVGYAPSSVVLDAADSALLVANDKGIGTTGYGVLPPPTNTAENSYANEFGVSGFNTHQDLGTVSIVPVPNSCNSGGDDDAGLPEQPLGSGGKYLVCLRWQPECHAGRNPGEDRRSFADQARVRDHP